MTDEHRVLCKASTMDSSRSLWRVHFAFWSQGHSDRWPYSTNVDSMNPA